MECTADPEIPAGEGDLVLPGIRDDGGIPPHLAGSGELIRKAGSVGKILKKELKEQLL